MTDTPWFPAHSEAALWEGDEGRGIKACDSCPCGCDNRGGFKGLGYITGSTPEGKGFSLWIKDPLLWERIREVFQAHDLTESDDAQLPESIADDGSIAI